VNLGGSFSFATLGTFTRSASTINLTGTFDNAGTELLLDAAPTVWNLAGGTIIGGRVSSPGPALSVTGDSTFGGVTLNTDVAVLTAGYDKTRTLTAAGGLTLENNHKLTLQRWDAYSGNVVVNLTGAGAQMLGGTGEIVFADPGSGIWDWRSFLQAASGTLTIGSGITVRGFRGVVGNGGLPLDNQGTIRADAAGAGLVLTASSVSNDGIVEASGGGTLVVSAPVTNRGTIQAIGGSLLQVNAALANSGVVDAVAGTVDVNGPLTLEESGVLRSQAGQTISVSGNLVSTGTNAAEFHPLGTVRLDGTSTAGDPRLLEAMSQDRGPFTIGYDRNFAFGTLALANNTYVKLVDQSHNVPGAETEAVYVTRLVVPAGTTLDLNGLHLYARALQVAGSVVNGSVGQVRPLADAGADQSVSVGDTVTLDGSQSDPHAGPLTYQWSFVSRPAGSAAVLSDASAVNPTFSADLAGTYTVQLIVNDGYADSQPATVTVTVDQPVYAVDLKISYFEAPAIAERGEALGSLWGDSLKLAISNIGSAASGPFSVGLYLSPDPIIVAPSMLLENGRVDIVSLAAGSSLVVRRAFRPARRWARTTCMPWSTISTTSTNRTRPTIVGRCPFPSSLSPI
jgi:hypothetical protein